MKVEFLLVYEDKTWDTEIEEIPENLHNYFHDDELISWWYDKYAKTPKYQKVLFTAVFSIVDLDD